MRSNADLILRSFSVSIQLKRVFAAMDTKELAGIGFIWLKHIRKKQFATR